MEYIDNITGLKRLWKKYRKTELDTMTDSDFQICFDIFNELDDEHKNIFIIMVKCSSESWERIFKLIEDEVVQFYENYDNLMEREGWAACSFICGKEVSEDVFQLLYDQGLLDDDRIYRTIAINHTVYHPFETYTEPYVVWFN